MPKYIYPFLFSFFILFSCSKTSFKKEISILKHHKQLWEAKAIRNYTVIQELDCQCPDEFLEPKHVEVRDGKIVALNGLAVTQDYVPYKTMDVFFEFIEEKIAKNPVVANLDFNPLYGFPKQLYFDMDQLKMDEEIGFKLTNFTILD